MIRYLAAVALAVAATLGSCSPAETSSAGAYVDPAQQKRAYEVGHDDALAMLDQCKEPSEVRLRLLEVRSRITTIRDRVSPEAADDYELGFRKALEERGDTLARVLFE